MLCNNELCYTNNYQFFASYVKERLHSKIANCRKTLIPFLRKINENTRNDFVMYLSVLSK